jgi:hypothetical protein
MIISKMLFVTLLVILTNDPLLKVIHVLVLIKNLHIRNNKSTNVYIYILHTMCQNSDIFQSTYIIFKELLNINKACTKTYMVLLGSCLQTCMTYTIAECTANKLLMMD